MLGPEIAGLARLGFWIPAFEFDQHSPQQNVVRDASQEGGFRNSADEYRHLAGLEGPAEPVSQFWVCAGRVHP
jgi:hypothetical protein